MKESWVNQHHHRHTLDFFSLSSCWFSERFKCVFLFVNWHLRESSRDLPQEFSDVYGCRHTWTCGAEFHGSREKCGIFGAVNTWFGDLCGLYLGSGLIFVAVFHLAAGHKVATCPFRCLRLGILSNNHRSPSRPPWIFRIRQKYHEIFEIIMKYSE